MARRSSMRASDADRERVVERLSQAAAEGRLLAHELEERLSVALRARTYGELDATVADLPSSAVSAGRGARSVSLARSHPAAALVVAACAALVLLALAAVAVAAFFAFGGIWLILAVVVFARRGRWSAGYGRRYGRGRYHRGWI